MIDWKRTAPRVGSVGYEARLGPYLIGDIAWNAISGGRKDETYVAHLQFFSRRWSAKASTEEALMRWMQQRLELCMREAGLKFAEVTT